MTFGLEELSEEEIREACIQYATENCFGTKFAREAEISVVSNNHFYHYQIETFGEKREIHPRSVPYKGQLIDGPENGLPPTKWDISVELPTLFRNDQRKVEVPHTASIRKCLKCTGSGRAVCGLCLGMRWRNCSFCIGGRRSNELCPDCGSSGRSRCWTCNETGEVKCVTCDGVGKLKHYKELTITWTTHLDSFCSDPGSLPRHLILKVNGIDVFSEQKHVVTPIDECENQSVNTASRRYVRKHGNISYLETIRQQRHALFAVPICKSTYSWKNKNGEFYVYGTEKRVYFPSYPPGRCFCACL